jgi:hypothetical protein
VLPRQLALNFERGAELSPGQRKEIVTHHWEVAGPDAYPWLVVLDEDLVARSPTQREISIAEALARALCLLVDDYDAELDAAARGETAFSCELKVQTRFGDLVVVLEAPQAVMNSPELVNAVDSVAMPVAAASPLGQDDLTQGKLAANTGMASPPYPPR